MKGFKSSKRTTTTQGNMISWGPRYTMNISIIDKQHYELFLITNELFETCLKGHDFAREQFSKTVSQLVKYINVHFTTEETMMENVKYPGFASHKRAHDSFIKRLLEGVKHFDEGRKFVPNAFVRYLRDWITSHIAMSDKKVCDYIINLKKEGRLLESIAA
jgi:hemerythrin